MIGIKAIQSDEVTRREKVSDVERKRIMFFIYRLGGGGAARTLLNIINHLDRKRFEPILVTLDFTYPYERYVKEDVTFIKLPVKRLRQAILPLAQLLRQETPDLLFSTVPNYNTVAILAKLLSGTKTKLVVREAAYLGGHFRENLKLKGYGFLYRFADRVVALSEGVKDNLTKRYHVREDKIEVIYNPVDLAHIEAESKREVELAPPFNQGKRIILTAGRLVPEKDHATLLRAFARIPKDYRAHLVLLGEGELAQSLQELAQELGIEEDVSFLGFQQNPYAYMKQAEVFTLTSLSEGFGHVLVEALAVGLPIVSTRCNPGAEEILGDERYGILVDVGDDKALAEGLCQALDLSETEREAIVAKGKERAQDFSAQRIVAHYETMFISILEGQS